jgi:hypothetical protein
MLLLERHQIALSESRVYGEMEALEPLFPELSKVDEIWFANTSILASEGWVYFRHLDNRGPVEDLSFENGRLRRRRADFSGRS